EHPGADRRHGTRQREEAQERDQQREPFATARHREPVRGLEPRLDPGRYEPEDRRLEDHQSGLDDRERPGWRRMARELDRQRERRGEPAMLGQLACGERILRGVVAEQRGTAAEIPCASVKRPERIPGCEQREHHREARRGPPCRWHGASLPALTMGTKPGRRRRPATVVRSETTKGGA